MLVLDISGGEVYLENEECFASVKPVSLKLEHSLLSISKWETKWKKPFLDRKQPKTYEESVDYIKCMTLNQNLDPLVYRFFTSDMLKKVDEYINDEATATTFSNTNNGAPNRQVITSELIYYWMFGYGIPIDCQKWHLNRLLTLIRIFDIKTNGSKKMGRHEILAQNKALNDARRKAAKTKG